MRLTLADVLRRLFWIALVAATVYVVADALGARKHFHFCNVDAHENCWD